MTDHLATFAAVAITLYAAHHVGDYWAQTDKQAKHKGAPGAVGRVHCISHVSQYIAVQGVLLNILGLVIPGTEIAWWKMVIGLAVSGVTHYIADRREPLKKIAKLIPGKASFTSLGTPRDANIYALTEEGVKKIPLDNPQLATGLWALDQSWHIFWGVFVAALIIAA